MKTSDQTLAPLGPWFNTSQDDSLMGEVMDQPLDSGTTLHISISGARAKEAARLIAVAPDLLAALQEIASIRDTESFDPYNMPLVRRTTDAWEAIRAAITKATESTS